MDVNIFCEQWKLIKGYEAYEISNYGRVRSIGRYVAMPNGGERWVDEKILKPIKAQSRVTVKLFNDFGYAHFQIRRLVAEHFIETPNNYRYVINIDGNYENNQVSNLMWRGYAADKRFGERNHQSRLSNDTVKLIKMEIGLGKRLSEIAAMCHVSPSHISRIKSGIKRSRG